MRYLPLTGFLGLSLLWGSEWLLTESLPAQPLLRSLAVRYLIAAALLLPWAMWRRLWRKPARILGNAAVLGIGILCLPQVLIFLAHRNLSPVFTLIAMAAVPVLLAIRGHLSIGTAICGMAGVIFLTGGELGLPMHQAIWLLLPVGAAGVLAWALVETARSLRGISIGEALFVQCVVAGVLLCFVSQGLEHDAIAWSLPAAIGFFLSAALPALGGYLLFYWLLRKLGAGRASMLQWTQTVVATGESAALMQIRPGWQAAIGALLVVIAVIWGFSNRDNQQGVMLEITQA